MISWDLSILRLVNVKWTHPVLDWLMPAVSALEAWLPLMILAVALVLWRCRWRGVWLILCIAVTITVSDGLVSRNLKFMANRVRPRTSVEGLIIRDLATARPEFMRLFKAPVIVPSANLAKSKGGSFPSSHTMNMFALATMMALWSRRWSAALYLLATLVAYSRLYCAAHWPSDIVPSMGMGILIGWAVPLLLFWLADRLGFLHRVRPLVVK
ncbi:MAG: phosphatase PAP2 family protein [Verrucomicrobiota bacterium]